MFRFRTFLMNMHHFIKMKPTPQDKYKVLSKYLLVTNITVSIGFSGLGDYLEQLIEIISKYRTDWNKTRTLKLAATGLPVGIICHYFYIYVDKFFIETNFKTITYKILLAQIVCSPLCILLFYSTLGLLNQWTKRETFDNMITKGSKVYIAEWIIWPPAYIISFYFLSTRHRVIYDNIISLGFNIFNSYIVHKENQK